MNRPRQLTDEVIAAQRELAAQRGDDPPPAPDGQIRYHIAVEPKHLHQGTASNYTVASILRAIADQLDHI
jgi:hypothetical protein